MWSARFGQSTARGTPVLDPNNYALVFLLAFADYWLQQIQLNEGLAAAQPPRPLAAAQASQTETQAPGTPTPRAQDVESLPSPPRLWHCMAHSWNKMDNALKNNILDLQERSSLDEPFELRFWSHAAVCDYMDEFAPEVARRCFYLLNSEYGAARQQQHQRSSTSSVSWQVFGATTKARTSCRGAGAKCIAGFRSRSLR